MVYTQLSIMATPGKRYSFVAKTIVGVRDLFTIFGRTKEFTVVGRNRTFTVFGRNKEFTVE